MSKYTTQVRFICETEAGLTESVGFSGINEVIQKSIPKVFNFDFPIYDESYRNVLCGKILKHYYTREIGAETVGLWKLWLDTRLNEIMPYYNQLYKSAMIEFNPMYDIELTTTHTRDNTGHTETDENVANTNAGSGSQNKTGDVSSVNEQTAKIVGTDTNNATSTQTGQGTTDKTQKDLFSDTPQGALDNVENETYLTNARKIADKVTNSENSRGEFNGSSSKNQTEELSSTNNSNNTEETSSSYENTFNGSNHVENDVTSTEEYVQKIMGKTGGASYSKRLQEFRSTFLNIDVMIIDELKDLFINLW